ncbi:Utp12 domain-containing protein [Aphelenchoides fujianensis]|nr:Utp12 domain-containing protein [Aphelenchoides fujianensis]
MAVLERMENGEQTASSSTNKRQPPSSSATTSAGAEDKIHTYNLLLSQAIKANDWNEINDLMRTIWTDGGPTAKRVARRLNVVDLVPLLRITAAVMREERLKSRQALSFLFRESTVDFSSRHIQSTNNWVGFVTHLLQSQSAYLSMLDDLDTELNDLLDYVRRRSSQMQKLMQLDGKIAWMIEKADQRKTPVRHADQQAAVVFEDSDEQPAEEVMDGVE